MIFAIDRTRDWGVHRPEDRPCKKAWWDAEKRTWFIDIDSADELMLLCAEVNHEIIIDYGDGSLPELEIYDSYRE